MLLLHKVKGVAMDFIDVPQIKEEDLHIKVSTADKAKIKAFAERHKMTMTAAVIAVFNLVIRQEESIEKYKTTN